MLIRETLNKLIPFMVRRPKEAPMVQARHERNQNPTARPELIEELAQSFPKGLDVLQHSIK